MGQADSNIKLGSVRALGVSRGEMLVPRASSCSRLIERGPRGDPKGRGDYLYYPLQALDLISRSTGCPKGHVTSYIPSIFCTVKRMLKPFKPRIQVRIIIYLVCTSHG